MVPSIRHVILDRDGVLNVESSNGRHVSDWSQWRWIVGAREGLAMLSHAGVHLSVATNQSGIGRGAMTRAEVDAIHLCMLEEVAQTGAAIDHVWVCPHAPDAGCACRKPSPGLLLQAIRASGVPASATVVVGDDLRDMQAAWAAEIPGVLLRTGKGRITEAMLPQDSNVDIFDDLRAFAAAKFPKAIPGVAKIS